eukprot:scaffold120181_cov46-Prasinocladus_malaysianus.AAC.1
MPTLAEATRTNTNTCEADNKPPGNVVINPEEIELPDDESDADNMTDVKVRRSWLSIMHLLMLPDDNYCFLATSKLADAPQFLVAQCDSAE